MGIDVPDGLGGQTGVAQGVLHGAGHAFAGIGGSGHVESVVGSAVAHHFGVDLGAAGLGVFQFFQLQQAGAFTDDEAVAGAVEGTGGLGRLVIVMAGKGLQGREAGHAQRRHRGFHTAGDGRADAAQQDLAEGGADAVDGGSTGGGGHDVGAFGAGEDGDLAGAHVGDEHGDQEGRNLAGTTLQQLGVVGLDGLQATQADAQDDAHVVGVVVIDDQAGVFEELLGGHHGELGEAVHAAGLFGRDEIFGNEVFHFAGNARVIVGGIEKGDGADTGFAGKQALPGSFKVIAQRGDGGKTSDDNARTTHGYSLDRRGLVPGKNTRVEAGRGKTHRASPVRSNFPADREKLSPACFRCS